MTKFLASVITLESFIEKCMQKCIGKDEIHINLEEKKLVCEDAQLDVESVGTGSFTITRRELQSFRLLLSHLYDQPALFVIDEDGRFWLKEVIIN